MTTWEVAVQPRPASIVPWRCPLAPYPSWMNLPGSIAGFGAIMRRTGKEKVDTRKVRTKLSGRYDEDRKFKT